MREGIQIAIGVIALIVAFFLWKDHADRIAKTRYWPLGWALYMLLIVTAGKTLGPFLSGLPINDDVAVPCLAFGVMLLCTILLCVQMYKMRKLRKG
jgi:hypothetical protein